MKHLLLALFLSLTLFAQDETPDCGWYGNKTVAERNAVFPFNVAKRVVLVAFPSRMDYTFYTEAGHIPLTDKIPVLDTIAFKLGNWEPTYYITERAELDEEWTNELSNFLINYTFKKEPSTPPSLVNCYEPRNAILFYDEAGTLICCYEFCYHCHNGGMYPDPDDVNNFDEIGYCREPIKLLKFIFNENGISFGLEDY